MADDAGLARAEQHFNKAQALYAAEKFDEAASEFLAAYEVRNLAPFLFNAGASYEKLAKSQPEKVERWDRAIELYEKYLDAEPEARDGKEIRARITVLSAERDRIRAVVTRLEQRETPEEVKTSAEVDELADVAIRGLVVVESDPAGANIYINDKSKGPVSKTPWSGNLEGEHTIYIEHQGFKPREMTISPSPDRLVVLSVALAEESYLGWLEITSNVPGADIYMDDKSVGVFARTPFSGNVKPGKRTVWITTEGYDEHHEELEIKPGKAHAIRAELKGSPVGYLHVRGSGIEQATVYVDGEVLCERGPCRKAVKEGRHTVAVKRSGYKTFTRKVDIQPKTETTLRVDLAEKPGRGDAVWAYLFSAAFAGGGVYLGLQAKEIHDELQDDIERGAPPPHAGDPRFQRGKLFTAGADVAYGLAGVTFLTAIYYTFRDKGPPSEATVDVRAVALQPQVTPGYAGIGVEVSW